MPPEPRPTAGGPLDRLRLFLPFYLGVAGMVTTSVVALAATLDAPEFALRCHLFALTGLAASLLGACLNRNPAVVGALIAVVVFPLLILSNVGTASAEFLFPSEALSDHTILLPTLAVWGMIAISFAQANRANSIFIFVCGLVVFGLTGTLNVNESLVVNFFLFLLSTFFVWGYGNLLQLRDRALEAGQLVIDQPRRWASNQAGVGVALTGIVLGLSLLAGYPVFRYTRPLFLSPFMQQYRQRYMTPMLRNYSGFDRAFSLAGGPIRLGSAPVVTVECRKPYLWRGMAYDVYDGRSWSQALPGTWVMGPVRDNGLLRLSPPAARTGPPGPEEGIWQRFTPRAPLGAVILGAATPVAFQPDQLGRIALVDRYGCLLPSMGSLGVGASYTVVSTRPFASEEDLARAPAEYPADISESYLAVPALTRSKLQSLADEITAECRSPYEKVGAIEGYLYRTCRYTLDVPPLPMEQDAVTFFVRVSRRGACDLYASSLAVLLRLAGVPARVATGFASGEYDARERAFVVRASDAHAWAEVYFPGIGWVEFDPPSQEAPTSSWLSRLFEPGWAGPTLRLVGQRALAVAGLALLLHLLFHALAGVSPAGLALDWFRRRRGRPGPRQRAALAYQRICRAYARHGLARPAWQAPGEFARRVGAEGRTDPEAAADLLAGFTTDFERLRYGAAEPSEAELAALQLRADLLARRIGKRKRRR